MMSTSVTGPNIAKYSLSFSELVCQLRPPTKSFDGDGEVVPVFVGVGAGVERPLDDIPSSDDKETFTCHRSVKNASSKLLRSQFH